MSGAKACIETLIKEGVEVIFGLPGGATLPIYDVIVDKKIEHILVRHEQCAAHMADGYARASGRPGVCMATSGPGATNLVTGIATAYMDSSPIVAITGQVGRPFIGRDAFQEADIIGITSSITKHNFQPSSVKEIPAVIKAALQIAAERRPGPVLVDLPKDIQVLEADVDLSSELGLRHNRTVGPPPPSQIAKAVHLLSKAERPVILAGGGVRISNAVEEIKTLSEKFGIPVTTTFMGKGCLAEDHPNAAGMIGMHGRLPANMLINEADVILAVGCRFSDRSTGSMQDFAKSASIIHADIDASEIGKNIEVEVPIVGDAKVILNAILKGLADEPHRRSSNWLEHMWKLKRDLEPEIFQTKDEKTLRPPTLLKRLRKLLPPDTIVTTDVGQHQMWVAINFAVYHPRYFISSGGLGTMGFGFPAALGAKVAKPDKPVVNFTGDGSFLMVEQELATSIKAKIPVVVVIFNNTVLGMVAQWQRLFYGRRYSEVDLSGTPDFVKLAEAYGAIGKRVQSYEELEEAVKGGLRSDVTTVVDVPISPEENVFPMVAPGKGLLETLIGD
ncbi:MAG: biosynthetic-type acetolactate synthase large subunit [Candidatus Bathyarchaeia archaeon]